MNRGQILAISLAVVSVVWVVVGSGIAYFFGLTGSDIALGVLLGAIPAGGLLAALIYTWWAPKNLMFTFVKEGTAKIVVRGKAFEKVLLQWEGHTIARTDGQTGDPPQRYLAGDVVPGTAEKGLFGGLRFYGLWPIMDILFYEFGWTGVKEDGKVEPHPPRTLDYVLVRDDVYWTSVENAEDANRLPLTIELLLTIQVVNPEKAVFAVQNWLETVINRVKPAVRYRVSQHTFEDLITQRADTSSEIFGEVEVLRTEFWERYGVLVRKLEIKEINPPENLRDVTLKAYVAAKEKEATVTAAKAKAEATIAVAEADARAKVLLAEAEKTRLATVYETVERFGDVGKLIRTLEAMEASPGQGAKWVIPLPSGFGDLIGGIFPGKTPASLVPEDVQRLLAALQELLQKNQAVPGEQPEPTPTDALPQEETPPPPQNPVDEGTNPDEGLPELGEGQS